MNNVVMRKINVNEGYQPLSDKPVEVLSVDISAPPTNANPVYFRGDGYDEIPWIQGEFHGFKSVDLARIWVRGTDGDSVQIVGGSW